MNVIPRATIPGLNVLRLVGALYLVAYHATPFLSGSLELRFLSRGASATSVFFLLSGYLLSFNYSFVNVKFEARYRFILRRFFRLAPPYYLALLLFLCTFFVGARRPELPDLTTLILSFSMLQSWFIGHSHDLVGPSWSVSCLMFFYLTMIFAEPRLRAVGTGKLWLLATLVYLFNIILYLFVSDNALRGISVTNWNLFFHNGPLFRAAEFYTGIILSITASRTKKVPPKYMFVPVLFAVMLLMLAAPASAERINNGVFLPLILLLIVSFSELPERSVRFLNSYWVKELADATICVYLFHIVFFGVAKAVFGPFWSLSNLLAFLVFILTFSVAVNRYVCRPTTQWLNRRFLPRALKPSATGEAALSLNATNPPSLN